MQLLKMLGSLGTKLQLHVYERYELACVLGMAGVGMPAAVSHGHQASAGGRSWEGPGAVQGDTGVRGSGRGTCAQWVD